MEIKYLLKSRRKELGLTQKEVANVVGVSEATVSRWESGEISNMTRPRIMLLAQVLQLSPAILCGAQDCDYDDTLREAKNAPSISREARKIAEQYDNLDSHGKRMVDFIIDEETARMQTEQNTIRIYRAANSIDHAAPRIEERSASDMEKLRKATPVTSEDDL